jgi:hypothetical protein
VRRAATAPSLAENRLCALRRLTISSTTRPACHRGFQEWRHGKEE